jgi:hypothetical protein
MSRRALVLRGCGVLLALALGGFGAWLLVTAHQLRWVRIGALAELWGVLVGAFALFGARHRAQPASPDAATPEVESAESVEPVAEPAAAPTAASEDEVQYDKRMEDILRREIRSVLTRELNVLRAQVAALRSDVLEQMRPDDAPAVAATIQTTQRRLAVLAQHDIAPAGQPIGVELPGPDPGAASEPVPTPEPEPEPELELELELPRAHLVRPRRPPARFPVKPSSAESRGRLRA